MKSAPAAAYTAFAAASAFAAPAKRCADILRKHYPNPPIATQ